MNLFMERTNIWPASVFPLKVSFCRDREHPSCSGETTSKYVHVASLQGTSICCRSDDMTASEWNPTAPRFKSALVLEASTEGLQRCCFLSPSTCAGTITLEDSVPKRLIGGGTSMLVCWWDVETFQEKWGNPRQAEARLFKGISVRLWSLTWTFYSEDVLPCLLFLSAIFVTALIFNSDAPIDRPGTGIRRFPVFSARPVTGRSVSHVSNHKITSRDLSVKLYKNENISWQKNVLIGLDSLWWNKVFAGFSIIHVSPPTTLNLSNLYQ